MHSRYILILLIAINVTFSQNKIIEKDILGVATEKGAVDSQGRQTGLWEKRDKRGNILAQQNYKMGKLHGLEITYFDKERISRQSNFVNGKKEGVETLYHNNGQISSLLNYKNGNLHGEALSYYQNGAKRSIEKWKNGSGIVEEYYENGAISKIKKIVKSEFVYFLRSYDNDGRLYEVKNLDAKGNGVSEITKSDGTVVNRGVYKDFHCILEKYFYESGIIKEVNQYKWEKGENKSWLQKSYDKAGKLRKEDLHYTENDYFKVYKDSLSEICHWQKKTGSSRYKTGYIESHYYDGKIAEQGNYKKDSKDGIWKTFYKDGKLKFIGKFVSNNPQLKDSTHTYYYPNGQIEKIEHYQIVESKHVKGVLSNYNIGSWKTYYKNGNLKEITNYPEVSTEKNDLPRKHFVYFENGKLKLEESILKDGRLTGVYKTYFENGVLASEINYYGGKKDGKATEYFEDGKIKFAAIYDWTRDNDDELIYYYKTSSEKKAQRMRYNTQRKIVEFFSPDDIKIAELTFNGSDKDYKDIKVFNTSGKQITLNEFASVDKNFKVKDCVMLYDQNEFLIDIEIEFENSERSYTFNKTYK